MSQDTANVFPQNNRHLDALGRPWVPLSPPQVEDPWNWIPYRTAEGELRYQRILDGAGCDEALEGHAETTRRCA